MTDSFLLSDLHSAIANTTTPGLASVFAAGKQCETTIIGRLGFALPPATQETIYDLASLTKILCTTVLCAQAVDEGKIDLDEKPWPNWSDLKVRHILAHTGGLPAWAPFFEEVRPLLDVCPKKAREIVIAKALATKPVLPVEQTTLYTDIGFLALGELVAERLGAPLQVLMADIAQRYYQAPGLVFLPTCHRHPLTRLVAPTEYCTWRHKRLQGQVHDDNAYAMGGVSGHAGLFGSLHDVQKAAQWFLGCLNGSEKASIAKVIRAFAKEPGQRALGFDKATPDGSTAGTLSSSAIGHLGFTGVSLWIDPTFKRHGSYFILLTNRLYYGRNSAKILKLRRQFHTNAKRILV